MQLVPSLEQEIPILRVPIIGFDQGNMLTSLLSSAVHVFCIWLDLYTCLEKGNAFNPMQFITPLSCMYSLTFALCNSRDHSLWHLHACMAFGIVRLGCLIRANTPLPLSLAFSFPPLLNHSLLSVRIVLSSIR